MIKTVAPPWDNSRQRSFNGIESSCYFCVGNIIEAGPYAQVLHLQCNLKQCYTLLRLLNLQRFLWSLYSGGKAF